MNKPTRTNGSIPPMTLGWKLRMALEASPLTQEDMAELVESHRTTLTRWMHDEIVPKRLYLKIWADATNVPFEWLEEELPAPDKSLQPPHKSRRRRSPSTRWETECDIAALCAVNQSLTSAPLDTFAFA